MQTRKWKCRLKCHPSPRKETTRYFSSGALLGFICLQEHLWVIQGKFSLCHHNAWALLRALMATLCLNPNAVLSSYVSVFSISAGVRWVFWSWSPLLGCGWPPQGLSVGSVAMSTPCTMVYAAFLLNLVSHFPLPIFFFIQISAFP